MTPPSHRILIQLRLFLKFALLSGLGWLCDFASFTLLVKLVGTPGFLANFISSYVGVTFVWFTSLTKVFGRTGAGRGRFLLTYWGFQLASILAYSQLLHVILSALQSPNVPILLSSQPEISSKIIVTPFNLITNFLFMKFLTRFMQQASPAQS